MVDGLTTSMRASHMLALALLVFALISAAVGAALNDVFYLRLATEVIQREKELINGRPVPHASSAPESDTGTGGGAHD